MHRRALVTLVRVVMVATVCILVVQGARAWGSSADRHRRVQELAARESYLYSLLADRNAVLESQRSIYMERFRKLEGQLRDREQDVAALRARLRATVDQDELGSPDLLVRSAPERDAQPRGRGAEARGRLSL